ncbi:MAG: Trp biosynthesis-associated membrane protein [Dermatophilaceae bacterium]
MTRLRRKGSVALLGVLAALGLLAAGFQPWATGAVDDAVLGATGVSATGSEVAPGLSGVALAVAAAVVAVITAGRVGRVVALVGYALCLAGATSLIVRVLVDPGGALGPLAATRVGRTGTVATTEAAATGWPWLALAAVVVGAVGLLAGVLGARSWGAPTSRYDIPRSADAAGPRGERISSDWDRLSAGQDPTDFAGPDPTDSAREQPTAHPGRPDSRPPRPG